MDKSKQKCGGIEFCDECIYGNPCYEKVNDDSDYLYDIYEDDRLIELEKESD